MSIFDRFEDAVEKGVNSAFSRMFHSGIKPVDVTTAIKRAMDDGVQELSAERTVAPNAFLAELAPRDVDALGADQDVLVEEFEQEATDHAEQQGYVLLGPIHVDLQAAEAQMGGRVDVRAQIKRGTAAPATAIPASPSHPIIDIDGQKWLLTEPVTVIGRGSDADVVVRDPGVSRRHLELRVTPTGVIATDLGSTNGTYVEGHRIDAATLVDGNQIVIGRTRILFWTRPDAAGGAGE